MPNLNQKSKKLNKEKCSCGEPHISDRVVHRTDGLPCYVTDPHPFNNEKWEERFDKETSCWDIASSVRPLLKQLIKNLLSSQRESVLNEVLEKIEEQMFVIDKELVSSNPKSRKLDKYEKIEPNFSVNQALSEIKVAIQSKMKE